MTESTNGKATQYQPFTATAKADEVIADLAAQLGQALLEHAKTRSALSGALIQVHRLELDNEGLREQLTQRQRAGGLVP
jgi:regulator of replication initiation timing